MKSTDAKEMMFLLPKTFFGIGWTKIGIVAKNGGNLRNIFKADQMPSVGFTFCIKEKITDFENDHISYDGFFLEDGLSNENLEDISTLAKFMKPYKYLVL